jgi:hypothetical protein
MAGSTGAIAPAEDDSYVDTDEAEEADVDE